MNAHDLYGLPLERFVPERAALAKALRAEGQRGEATEVTKLPKPSRAAWAVNQLVRTQGRSVAMLFDAGDALQRAQADVIAGRGDARALREAAERERAAVKRLTDAARGLLTAEGHGLTAVTLDRVSETLHAAALDEDARAEVREGCLQRELRHIGLGAAGALSPAAPPRAGSARPRSRASGTRSRSSKERDAAERAASEQAARERAEQLRAARRIEAEARRAAERAARELRAAHERHDRAAEVLSEAEDSLAAAREHAERAERNHRRAQDALERLQK